MFDYDPEPIPEKEEEKTVEVVGIRFRNGGKVYYFAPGEIEFIKGEHAIVETVRGVEYGEVALSNKMVGESEVVFPLKPVMRKATKEDDERNIENRKLEENAKPIWYEKVAKNGLEMQLIDVEYTHDNAKLCFYFTADGRVDFRELVKDLASVFRTRIELRQIGVRDEAKLFGGLGSCGRPFCCNTFLPDFAQVSIKMAKDQNLSLSSSKISGACGRLMCCLRFEHDTYEREYATFPKVDTIVDTPKGRGVIIESSFLTGKIKVKMNNDQSIKIFGKSELKVLGMIKVREEVSEDLKKLEDK
ncbi:MAG: stage 0 sporulation family protein [Clostridia bacterium]|nr:stage 0 sporulation family protein [Clostridia bacterium]